MDQEQKQELERIIDDMVDGKAEPARVNFHNYLQSKMQERINTQNVNNNED